MERFSRSIRGYDPEEVNEFLDKVISNVEKIIEENNVKNNEIKELEEKINGYDSLVDKLEHYKRNEETLNRAMFMAQKTSDQMRLSAQKEREAIIEEAKRNANRIINEALLKAEKAENEAQAIKRNVAIFKRRMKDIIESQLEVVEEIEILEL